ncbi:TadE-like protein [bacterium BMS3Bbin10]|nr:TadE-like protein [bacterium BMS3Bbin10]HDL17095.1 pilus assembly protein [Hyphomicrobiales bacterium]
MTKSRANSQGKTPGRKRGFLRRFRADSSGVTAIEFGIVAAPFFALMVALIEVSLVFFANFTLENAVDKASRLIRTGQAQTQGLSEAQFKQSICDGVTGVYDCMGGLKLDVLRFDDFTGINLPDPLDGNGELRTNFSFDPGASSDVVVVRAFYEWNLIANFPGGLGNMPGGGRLLVATAAFRNEPFGD